MRVRKSLWATTGVQIWCDTDDTCPGESNDWMDCPNNPDQMPRFLREARRHAARTGHTVAVERTQVSNICIENRPQGGPVE